MEQDEFLSEVYLDSSLVVAAMIAGVPNHTACAAFCGRLAQQNSKVYFSQILRLEIAEAIRKLATRQQLPEQLRQEYQLNEWGTNYLVRHQWMAFGMAQFAAFVGTFYQVYELPFRLHMWRQSVQLMALYGLGSHDAVHVATALQNGVRAFASSDKHFMRVGTLDVHFIRDDLSH